jgi:hypothetical protein
MIGFSIQINPFTKACKIIFFLYNWVMYADALGLHGCINQNDE